MSLLVVGRNTRPGLTAFLFSGAGLSSVLVYASACCPEQPMELWGTHERSLVLTVSGQTGELPTEQLEVTATSETLAFTWRQEWPALTWRVAAAHSRPPQDTDVFPVSIESLGGRFCVCPYGFDFNGNVGDEVQCTNAVQEQAAPSCASTTGSLSAEGFDMDCRHATDLPNRRDCALVTELDLELDAQVETDSYHGRIHLSSDQYWHRGSCY